MPPNCKFKKVKMVNLMVCTFYHKKKFKEKVHRNHSSKKKQWNTDMYKSIGNEQAIHNRGNTTNKWEKMFKIKVIKNAN